MKIFWNKTKGEEPLIESEKKPVGLRFDHNLVELIDDNKECTRKLLDEFVNQIIEKIKNHKAAIFGSSPLHYKIYVDDDLEIEMYNGFGLSMTVMKNDEEIFKDSHSSYKNKEDYTYPIIILNDFVWSIFESYEIQQKHENANMMLNHLI